MSATNRQNRLDTLKIREVEGTLTQEERAELDAIFAELDAEEAIALKQAMEKRKEFVDSLMEKETELEKTVAKLKAIVTAQNISWKMPVRTWSNFALSVRSSRINIMPSLDKNSPAHVETEYCMDEQRRDTRF